VLVDHRIVDEEAAARRSMRSMRLVVAADIPVAGILGAEDNPGLELVSRTDSADGCCIAGCVYCRGLTLWRCCVKRGGVLGEMPRVMGDGGAADMSGQVLKAWRSERKLFG
jgi:hypothetical protein